MISTERSNTLMIIGLICILYLARKQDSEVALFAETLRERTILRRKKNDEFRFMNI